MGVEPFLAASSIEGVLAQRLVRRLCPHCRQAYQPSAAELAELGALRGWPPGVVLHRPGGCELCRGTGYRGRVGLFELLLVDDVIEEMVLRRASSAEIKLSAQERGLVTLREEGWQKVLDGVTSVEEVTRVTHEENLLGVGDEGARGAD
jgi:type II secretory ATPase GspE/PulE/Tfp pilus assembly ATPase PilB-like protein